MKSVVLHPNMIEALGLMEPAQAVGLIKAMAIYRETGEMPDNQFYKMFIISWKPLLDKKDRGGQIGNKNAEKPSKNECERIQTNKTNINEQNEYERTFLRTKNKNKNKKKILLTQNQKKDFLQEFEKFNPIVLQWLEYKSARRESYKTEQSIRAFAKKLKELSGDDVGVAQQIIDQSIANNWAGIFPLKKSNSDPPGERRNIDDPEHFVI